MFQNSRQPFTRFKRTLRNLIAGNNTTFPIGVLTNNKGSTASIEMLILMPLILFLIFGGTDFYVTQVQQDQVEHLKTYYLDRMKIEGTLTDHDRAEIATRLTANGYSDIAIQARDSEGNELNSSTVLVRNIEEPDEGKLILNVQATPKYKPFMFGKLLNATPTEDFHFNVGGETLSEKPTDT